MIELLAMLLLAALVLAVTGALYWRREARRTLGIAQRALAQANRLERELALRELRENGESTRYERMDG